MPATKHTQHAPSTKNKCDHLCGWIYKQQQQQQTKNPDICPQSVSAKMVNPTDIEGNAEEEEDHTYGLELVWYCDGYLVRCMSIYRVSTEAGKSVFVTC